MAASSILVAGAGGFLGAHLVHELIRRKHPVTALVRRRENAWRLASVANANIIEADLTHAEQTHRAFLQVRPASVINAASYGVGRDQRDFALMADINVDAVKNLLEAAAACDVSRFVQLGSYSEYGDQTNTLREDTSALPKDDYGRTKLAATECVTSFHGTRGLETLVLRLFNIWGPLEGRDRLIPSVIRHCRAKMPLDLTTGAQIKDYSFAPDVAEWIVDMTTHSTPYAHQVVNVSGGQRMAVRDLALAVARRLDGESFLRFGARAMPAGEVQTGPADTTRLNALLPRRRVTTLEEAISQTLAAPEAPC